MASGSQITQPTTYSSSLEADLETETDSGAVFQDGRPRQEDSSSQDALTLPTKDEGKESRLAQEHWTGVILCTAIEQDAQEDRDSPTEPVPRISPMATEDSDPPWDQPSTASLPSEDTIRENMIKHKNDILDCLNPSQLYNLYEQFELDELCTDRFKTRKEKTAILLEALEASRNESENETPYSDFLNDLMEESEHMGHRYIVSLLKGKKFANNKEIEQSKTLRNSVRKCRGIDTKLNVRALQDFLLREDLLMYSEVEDLQIQNTDQAKAQKLLTLLKTKGPTAYYVFVYNCLQLETSHPSHGQLYTQLTGKKPVVDGNIPSRKRKTVEDIVKTKTKVPKSNPCLLDSPEGLKSEIYLQYIRDMRKYNNTGRDMWDKAEDLRKYVLDSKLSLEIKIAILLESCTRYITDKNSGEVLKRVAEARAMCVSLHGDYDCNVTALEGRCQWVLAKMHRYNRDYTQATVCITEARSLLFNCERGEDRALINYCHACILLAKEDKMPWDQQQAVENLNVAIEYAKNKDYGLDVTHCKLRQVQACVGSSANNAGKETGEVGKRFIEKAMLTIDSVDLKELSPRTRCMCFYTWSDVYRVKGQMDKAVEHAELSMKIAEELNFATEITSAQLRLDRLKCHTTRQPQNP